METVIGYHDNNNRVTTRTPLTLPTLHWGIVVELQTRRVNSGFEPEVEHEGQRPILADGHEKVYNAGRHEELSAALPSLSLLLRAVIQNILIFVLRVRYEHAERTVSSPAQ